MNQEQQGNQFICSPRLVVPMTRHPLGMDDQKLYMYNSPLYMNWTIAGARKNFAEFVRASKREPQRVERYGELVGVMIGAELFDEFTAFQKARLSTTLGACLAEFRRIADETPSPHASETSSLQEAKK